MANNSMTNDGQSLIPAPGLDHKLEKLLIDPLFLELERKLRNADNNIFRNMSKPNDETLHSGFLAWLINPASDHGLGDFPLRRLIVALLNKASEIGLDSEIRLSREQAELIALTQCKVSTEEVIPNGRIDVLVEIGEGPKYDLRLVIENKIKARESNKQTQIYYNHYSSIEKIAKTTIYVFLTLDGDRASSPHFVGISYQNLCQFVFDPCLTHPSISPKAQFLIGDYVANLTRPIKNSSKIMAMPYNSLIDAIYKQHSEALDAIYMHKKGGAPAGTASRRIASSDLSDIIKAELIKNGEAIFATYKKKRYEAAIRLDQDDNLQVVLPDGTVTDTPSAAGRLITGQQSCNGWDFWSVVRGGKDVQLSEIRSQFKKLDLDE